MLIAVRFALYVDLMLVFGLPLFALYTLRGEPRKSGMSSFSRALTALSLLGLVLSVLSLLLLVAAMSEVPLFQLDRQTVRGMMDGTAIGTAAKVRIAVLLIAMPVGVWPAAKPRIRWALQSCLGAVALASLAWTGHGAADDGSGGMIHLTADIVHLLAAGLWVGALAGLLLILMRTGGAGIDRAENIALAHRALVRFSSIGTGSVALIVLSGVLNSWFLVGLANVASLASSRYGQLLMLKLVVFTGMIGLAGLNRFRLTPAIAPLSGVAVVVGLRSLRRSVAAEATLALTVLALVAWLGTLAPPASN